MVQDVFRDKFRVLPLLFVVSLSGCTQSGIIQQVKRAKVYACVPAIGSYTVGAQNKTTGVFWKYFDDTTWHHIGPENLKAFAVAPMNTSEGSYLYVAAGNGILRLTDDSGTWVQKTPWNVRDVTSVIVKGDTVICCSPYGVLWSRNEMSYKDWRRAGDLPRFVTGVISSLSGVQYLSSEEGLFMREGSKGFRELLKRPRMRSIVESRDGILAVVTENGEVLLSFDQGDTWVERSNGLAKEPLYAITFTHTLPNILYTGGYRTGIFKSTDLGMTWKQSGLEGKTVHAIMMDSTDKLIVGTTGYGIYESRDQGVTWSFSGLPGANVWSISRDK